MDASAEEILDTAHARIDRLVEALRAALVQGSETFIRNAFDELAKGILNHMSAEEADQLPALVRANPRMARVLMAEHRYLADSLREIGNAISGGNLNDSALRSLADGLRAHARTEDALFFPLQPVPALTKQRPS